MGVANRVDELDASLELAPDRSSPTACRRWLRRVLAGEELVDTVALLASEIVTNAVLYARTPILVRVRSVEDGIQVEVADGSPMLPVRRHYSSAATSGRGLGLVESLASAWGAEERDDGSGKAVWFRLARSPERRHQTADGLEGGQFGGTRVERRLYRFLGAPVAAINRAWEEYGGFFRELQLLDDPSEAAAAIWASWAAAEAIAPELRIFYEVRQQARRLARQQGAELVDVELQLAAGAGEAAAHLERFFDAAEDRYRGASQLLNPLPGPRSVALRRWLLGELQRQAAGFPPQPWSDGS